MQFRWKRVLLILVIIAIPLFGIPPLAQRFGVPPFVSQALDALHQYRVAQAHGVWCVEINPDGQLGRTLYGEKNCEMAK
jgi:hypothetical protein